MLPLYRSVHMCIKHIHIRTYTQHIQNVILKQEWQFTYIPSFSLVNLSSKIRNIYQGQGHRLVIGSCDDYMDYVVKRYCIHELSV